MSRGFEKEEKKAEKKEKPKKEKQKTSKELALEAAEKERSEKRANGEKYWNQVRNHVMNGVVKGSGDKVQIVGFHSKLNVGKKGCVLKLTGTKKNFPKGVYQSDITTAEGKVTKMSTFYPDAWTEEDIKEAVITAHMNKKNNIGNGLNTKGEQMQILFMGNGEDATAFPNV